MVGVHGQVVAGLGPRVAQVVTPVLGEDGPDPFTALVRLSEALVHGVDTRRGQFVAFLLSVYTLQDTSNMSRCVRWITATVYRFLEQRRQQQKDT